MIIDINMFFGHWPYWPLPDGDGDGVLRAMDRYGIERGFLSSLRGVFNDPEAGNAETLQLVGRHPDRFAPALTYSPYAKGWDRYEDELTQADWRIVELFPVNHNYDPLQEPAIKRICDYCGRNRIPILIPHRLLMSWRFPILPLATVAGLAEAHRETTFILGCINYLGELQTALHIMRKCPNVMLETSGMMAFEEVRRVVDAIGVARLIHGSALPLQQPGIGPLKIQTAEITEKEKERILSGNCKKLFSPLDADEMGADEVVP